LQKVREFGLKPTIMLDSIGKLLTGESASGGKFEINWSK
jgi:hypothetical protein